MNDEENAQHPSLPPRTKQTAGSVVIFCSEWMFVGAGAAGVFVTTACAAERPERAVARISCLVVNLGDAVTSCPLHLPGGCINVAPLCSPIQSARKVASGDSTRMASGSLFASSLRMMVCAPADSSGAGALLAGAGLPSTHTGEPSAPLSLKVIGPALATSNCAAA